MKTLRTFLTFHRGAALLVLCGLAVGAGPLASHAQQFADFEGGLDSFYAWGSPETGQTVAVSITNLVATSGAQSLCATKTPDGFSWTFAVSGSAASNNITFFNAMTDALNDTSNQYELVFDSIYELGSIPNAGTTNIGYINHLVAMSDDDGWTQTPDAYGVGWDVLRNLSNTVTRVIRVPLDILGLVPNSSFYQMVVSINGDWGTNDTVRMYYDDFRIEVVSDIVFDFESGLGDWVTDTTAGSCGGLPPEVFTDFPTLGNSALALSNGYSFPCRMAEVTKTIGSGHSLYRHLTEAVRGGAANYNLEFELIIRKSDLSPSTTFVAPIIAFGGDDGFTLDEVYLATNTVSGLVGTTSVIMQVSLDTWNFPADPEWNPSFVSLHVGRTMNGGITDANRVYYDNFAIRPKPPLPSPVLTDIAVPGDVVLTWDSHTGMYYAVERATSLNPDWAPITNNVEATPPQNTWTGYTPSGSPEFFRLDTSDKLVLVEPLIDYETGEEGFVLYNTNNPTVIYATNVFATSGTNSLAVAQTDDGFRWNTQWTMGDLTNNQPVWVSVSNALESAYQWYIVADYTWNGPDIPAGCTFVQTFIAFNGDGADPGWIQFQPTDLSLNGAQIAALQNETNSIHRDLGGAARGHGMDDHQRIHTDQPWVQLRLPDVHRYLDRLRGQLATHHRRAVTGALRPRFSRSRERLRKGGDCRRWGMISPSPAPFDADPIDATMRPRNTQKGERSHPLVRFPIHRPFRVFRVFRGLLFILLLWFSTFSTSAQTIVLEAEDGVLTGTYVSTSASGYSGTGYVTGFSADTDRVTWDFTAPSGGIHRLLIRYRSPYGPKGFGGAINGAGISGSFLQTGSFATHDAGLVEVLDGSNQLWIGGGWSYYEIDRVDLVPWEAPPPPLPVPAALVDTQATFAARVLMADLVADYGQITWSGQHETNEINHVWNVSGRKPVILSGDLINYSPSRVARQGLPTGYTESLIAADATGHVLSLAWHWNAPSGLIDTPDHEWWRGFYTHATTFDVEAALADTNSVEYGEILRDIDAIAVELTKISDAGLPVLWRPLHESEGGWFWWGAKGPEPFKELWRLLYDRLTGHHDLHHLIWVLTSQDPDWYPGDDVVDILGVDAYPSSPGDALSSTWEAMKARFDGSKLIALTEFGGVPDIERMHQVGVWWSYFAPWTGSLGPSSTPDATVIRIYQSPAVVTLDELNARPMGRTVLRLAPGGGVQLQSRGPRTLDFILGSTADLTGAVPAWLPMDTNRFVGGVHTFADPAGASVRVYRFDAP